MATVLTQLLDRDAAAPPEAAQTAITGITADSRKVEPGFLFAALPGTKADGARYIAGAIKAGAAAILVAEKAEPTLSGNIPIIRTPEPRLALARIAARFYGPGPDTIVAVTGTSGKTSVAEFTRQIFATLGHPSASLGTIGVVKPGGAVYGSLTTPDPVTLAKTLAGLRAEGITHLAMEASSHGLDQYRLDGVTLKAGAFTNLGRDHMDYHPTVEHYLDAKLRLFKSLLPDGATAVINADDQWSPKVASTARARNLPIISVGLSGETLKLAKVTPQGFGQQIEVTHNGHTYTVNLPLVGTYQASNALVAAGLAIASGCPATAVIAALPKLHGVKGRLEIIGRAKGGLGVVDYAHKPDALEAALSALRPFAPGKLICVFGCGGDRDKGKRPIMGAISAAKADVTIVTDDNPRTEDAAAIRAEVLAGANGPSAIGRHLPAQQMPKQELAQEIGDRAQAIQAAVAMMGAGDVVLVAGKGHEMGQIVGTTVLPFSDHDVLAAAMSQAEKA